MFGGFSIPITGGGYASSDFSRVDLADEYYNKNVFDGKTFADLVNSPKGKVPFLVLNATDIGIAHRFEFTQDQFDLLCSDLSGVTVSRAVAASSNFPVAFAPLTIGIYKETCGPLPQWVGLGLDRKTTRNAACRRHGRAFVPGTRPPLCPSFGRRPF